MRKSKTFIKLNVEEIKNIRENQDILHSLSGLNIDLPEWATVIFYVIKSSSMSVYFFEEVSDFLLSYSKYLVKRPEAEVFSCKKNNNAWQRFYPPTLLGVNLQTKLRRK